MLSCSSMKKGDVYVCKECGLEIEVKKECKDDKCSEGSCGSDCTFTCCGKELKKK